ncbi:hypothetical protein M5K25_000182 [Dendrobium thyrsiflorum]|uniref:Small ribosomal subunit protein uS8c n=1 Tax=Dendrobium thyrsiflorum TaxID=117978 RepID=A0ABD0VTA5_DENTH
MGWICFWLPCRARDALVFILKSLERSGAKLKSQMGRRILNDALRTIVNAERRGKATANLQPISTVMASFLGIMKTRGYIKDFQVYDPHRVGRITVELLGRIKDCKALTYRHDIKAKEIEEYRVRTLPTRQEGQLKMGMRLGEGMAGRWVAGGWAVAGNWEGAIFRRLTRGETGGGARRRTGRGGGLGKGEGEEDGEEGRNQELTSCELLGRTIKDGNEVGGWDGWPVGQGRREGGVGGWAVAGDWEGTVFRRLTRGETGGGAKRRTGRGGGLGKGEEEEDGEDFLSIKDAVQKNFSRRNGCFAAQKSSNCCPTSPNRIKWGYVVIRTPNGIFDHEEAIRQNVGGQVLGFFH